MSTLERNLTEGSVLKTIIYFSLPFLLSYFLQMLYGMADLFVIGLYNDVSSTTAVAIGSQVMHMITVVLVGLAMGSTVKIGRLVGAGLHEETNDAIGNTLTLFIGISAVLTVILLLLIDPIILVMKTPAEAVVETGQYLMICFIGIPFITAYNIISAIFRGLGDSRSPMYFIAIACVINVALDFLFVGAFSMGTIGVALATTIAQSISVLCAFIMMKRKNFSLNKTNFKPQKGLIRSILKVGVPVSLQDGCIQIAFLAVTVIANMRGLQDAAAVGIVEKIIGMLFLVPSAMLATVSALSAQNLGAGKIRRAKQTLRYAYTICIGFGVLMVAVMQFWAEPFVGLFTADAEVVIMGGQYMRGYIWDCIFAGIHFCFSGYFCACGRAGISFVHNITSIVLARVPIAYWASVTFADTLFPMGLATTTGSVISVIICIAAYWWLEKKKAVC